MSRMNAKLDQAADGPAARILSVAHDLFYRDGIRATGIDRIIADSGVAKKTFYRYFPSKHALIVAFLQYRHERWMTWFEGALTRHGASIEALVPALSEWFRSDEYRGCAFINAVVEVGGTMPEAVAISRRHKQDMTAAIEALLVLPHVPPHVSHVATDSPAHQDAVDAPAAPAAIVAADVSADAQALAVAVDGAIVAAQFTPSPDVALVSLARIVDAVIAKRTA